ncbi:hypothetical protein [Nannocystis sp.]|uniref:hypothetical protein n=1 Tax=Nannocystis sp. TaxID=1962667 RepID=UPI0025F063B1|nr:hypothetical protein [Nannocystis sp.]MBK7830493.1 hypothetical protein [Nannocystis sp.]
MLRHRERIGAVHRARDRGVVLAVCVARVVRVARVGCFARVPGPVTFSYIFGLWAPRDDPAVEFRDLAQLEARLLKLSELFEAPLR